ncbi:GNAT family N-acetyltransferase [Streptomyces sp. NPDC058001]|uniref:GNAT family N-acetyltransferase n=1 Tax=Streptomyces sp. NPDC058001 TaxID=3346300 RepID=UPI0036E662E5
MTTHSLTDAEIRGQGLHLRPWRADDPVDADAWLRGLIDPEFRRWNTPLRQVDDLADAYESLRARVKSAETGRVASFCVTDADTGTILGHIGLNEIDQNMRLARVGYWILPEARGRRVAGRALDLVSGWAFTELTLFRIELGHALGHDVSCRIAERCGYRYEGTLRGAMPEAGRWDQFRDAHLHARLATDPEPEPYEVP